MRDAIILRAIASVPVCGITGQLRLDDGRVDRALVRRMTARLAHRGPDDEQYHFDSRIGLGHRRLAIIDPAQGRQPMSDQPKSLVLAGNNEIYNYQELRRELEADGCAFRTNSDTEVVLRLFARERERSVARLEGMFALAIWDARSATLVLARDRFGVKPLYYYRDRAVLLFASEMRALLEYPRLNRALDLPALDGYFGSLALPEPQSVFRHVHKLPAGHLMVVRNGRMRCEPYWTPPLGRRARPATKKDVHTFAAELRAELDRSMAISLRSDVPVGVLLSGGLDSSTVATCVARVTGRGCQTFSATFEEPVFDEGAYSRLVARRLGTRHREVRITMGGAVRIAERLGQTLDEPFADSSAIPTFAVCELARTHVKAVLSGEGADELFGGYAWHLPRGRTRTDAFGRQRLHPSQVVFNRLERRRLYDPDWTRRLDRMAATHRRGHQKAQLRGLSPLDRTLLADLNGYLPSDILFKSDRMSMLHGLELRVPFLNHRLAEYALRLPDAMKVRRGVRKFLLRQIMANALPAEVLNRPKQGFAIPMDLWLWRRGAWRDLIYDTIFSRRTRERGSFQFAYLERLRQEHDRLERLNGYKLWTVFMFEMWQRTCLDRSDGSAA